MAEVDAHEQHTVFSISDVMQLAARGFAQCNGKARDLNVLRPGYGARSSRLETLSRSVRGMTLIFERSSHRLRSDVITTSK